MAHQLKVALTEEDREEQKQGRLKELAENLANERDPNVASLQISSVMSQLYPSSAVPNPPSRERCHNRVAYHTWMKTWYEDQLKRV